jgi:hypothetical protein
MASTFRIHPAIGIARLGNSPTEFYLSPEAPGTLPIACDAQGVAVTDSQGNETRARQFKDAQGRVKRQAARFKLFVYDDQSPQGRELKIGGTIEVVNPRSGQLITGTVTDVTWTVYLANKKAVWYEFKELAGEHGYEPGHPRRNADVTGDSARQKLIIDPGPRTVRFGDEKRRGAAFARSAGGPDTFPPPLRPNSIDTIGELKCNVQGGASRLIVLGGFGNSGSSKTDFGQPYITQYANNDGWFDDTSDGPVTAVVNYKIALINGKPPDPNIYSNLNAALAVDEPAWVVVGYPRYAPQIVDIVTMDDVVYDLAVRQFAFAPSMYGVPPFDRPHPPPTTPQQWSVWRMTATWNRDYRPYFWRDIWPILSRPNNYQWVMVYDPVLGGDPHNTQDRGNFDVNQLSVAPYHGEPPADRERRRAMRQFLYSVLRKPGQENMLTGDYEPKYPGRRPIGMPWLCGDNPLSNTVPSKFLRLTDTMLFLLRQWADGKFINEKTEGITAPAAGPGVDLDRGVLGTMLGGAFCPGGEIAWIVRNPAVYASAYRVNLAHASVAPGQGVLSRATAGNLSQTGDLAAGLEPGDLTKYSAVPWQSDFNECSTQDVDITYDQWNAIDPASTGDPVVPVTQPTFWWPSHRPMEVFTESGGQVPWAAGIPQTSVGDLLMVTAWKDLGFVLNKPNPDGSANFVLVEASPIT